MPVIIDLIMMGLLVGVIIHSVRLSKSLIGFKQLHSEILPLMQEYTKTVQSSFQQIDSMKKISGEIDHIINSRVPAALVIKKDLEFLVARSEELADHLELQIRSGRNQEFTPLKQESSSKVSKKSSTKSMTETPNCNSELEAVEPVVKKDGLLKIEPKITKSSKSTGKLKASFKPLVESFFLTKTAKKLLHKDGENTHAA